MEERGARGRVARLTIAREEKLNALDPETIAALVVTGRLNVLEPGAGNRGTHSLELLANPRENGVGVGEEADIGCACAPFRDGQPDVADAWSAAERASLRNIRAALDPERVLAFQRHPAF